LILRGRRPHLPVDPEPVADSSIRPPPTFERLAFEPLAFEPLTFEPLTFEPLTFEPLTFEPLACGTLRVPASET
jgi:hypothetical protein